MDPQHFSLYGNRITPDQDRKALQWQQMFVKKFGYDPDESYELSLHDNPQLGDVLGRSVRLRYGGGILHDCIWFCQYRPAVLVPLSMAGL